MILLTIFFFFEILSNNFSHADIPWNLSHEGEEIAILSVLTLTRNTIENCNCFSVISWITFSYFFPFVHFLSYWSNFKDIAKSKPIFSNRILLLSAFPFVCSSFHPPMVFHPRLVQGRFA